MKFHISVRTNIRRWVNHLFYKIRVLFASKVVSGYVCEVMEHRFFLLFPVKLAINQDSVTAVLIFRYQRFYV